MLEGLEARLEGVLKELQPATDQLLHEAPPAVLEGVPQASSKAAASNHDGGMAAGRVPRRGPLAGSCRGPPAPLGSAGDTGAEEAASEPTAAELAGDEATVALGSPTSGSC